MAEEQTPIDAPAESPVGHIAAADIATTTTSGGDEQPEAQPTQPTETALQGESASLEPAVEAAASGFRQALSIHLPIGEATGRAPRMVHLNLTGDEAVALAQLGAGLSEAGVQISHAGDALRWVLNAIIASK